MDDLWWSTTTDVKAMLDAVRGKAGERKLRLFACASIRRLWEWVGQPPSLFYLNGIACERRPTEEDEIEGYADLVPLPQGVPSLHPSRVLSYHAMEVAASRHADAVEMSCLRARQALLKKDAWEASCEVQRAVEIAVVAAVPFEAAQECDHLIRAELAGLLRDVLGNPFAVARFHPGLRSDVACALAATAYQDRKFDLLPQIADVLEAEGCTDTEMLGHCRGPGTHVRGCWVVDLLLGRE